MESDKCDSYMYVYCIYNMARSAMLLHVTGYESPGGVISHGMGKEKRRGMDNG